MEKRLEGVGRFCRLRCRWKEWWNSISLGCTPALCTKRKGPVCRFETCAIFLTKFLKTFFCAIAFGHQNEEQLCKKNLFCTCAMRKISKRKNWKKNLPFSNLKNKKRRHPTLDIFTQPRTHPGHYRKHMSGPKKYFFFRTKSCLENSRRREKKLGP